MPNLLLGGWLFLFGLCIGSFLNVCIYRLPLSNSITKPARSACPHCGKQIKFYDNIPIFSYILLRGRCRTCANEISARYPIVEALGGFFSVAIFFRFGITPEGLAYYIFVCALIVVVFIDIDHQIIPNVITLPGILFFFLAAWIPRHPICFFKMLPGWLSALSVTLGISPMVFNSALGILFGGGSLYLVAWLYYSLTGKEGMGGGDIKLLAMIGAMLGWEGVLFTIFIGSAVGTIAGIALIITSRVSNFKLRIPFGPFLSIGAITYIFFGAKMIYHYILMVRP